MPYSVHMKKPVLTFAATLIAMALPGAAIAQSLAPFPERTVKIVVPFDAGGTVDVIARALAQKLNEKWGQPVIVENRPGAGNTIGANAVAKAAPDGYSLLFANTSVSVNPSLFKSLPYDTLRELAPVMYLSPSPNVLLAQRTIGVKSLKELLALAKSREANPLSFASVGKGSAHHFCMELLQSEAGIKLLHVPYRGVTPALAAVNRVEVDLYCSDVPGAINLLQGDKVTPLGITSKRPSPALPNIPSFAAEGLPNYDLAGFLGIMTTGGTPDAAIRRINTAINEVIREPEFAKRMATFGQDMIGGTPEEFAKFLRDDIARYQRISQAAGITPE
jgi:tripartite-type tricarboxylate transporter receptor subunit TctC